MKRIFAPYGRFLSGSLAAALLLTSAGAHASTVAHYRFEDGTAGATATSAVDVSGNNFHLPAFGAPFFSPVTPVGTVPLTGAPNTLSADFGVPGNDAFVGVAGEGLSMVEFMDFTVEAWVMLHETAGWDTFVVREDTPIPAPGGPGQGTGGYGLFYLQSSGAGNMNSGFRVVVITRPNTFIQIVTNVPVLPNVWYHVAAVGDATAGTLSLFVNGVLRGSATGFAGLFVPTAPAGAWAIGRGQWNGGVADLVNGRIDEVRFSNVALSPLQFLNFGGERIEIARAPSSAVLWVGQNHTFSVEAALVGVGALQFQWESSMDGVTWTPISGATASSYTIVNAAIGIDGARYRVAISGPTTTVHTAPVLVRVGNAATPAPRGVVAHYRFEDGPVGSSLTGVGATDSSGNGHHLTTVTGGPLFSSNVPVTTLPQTRLTNNLAMDLGPAGNDAVAGVAGAGLSALEFTDFTIEAWVMFHDVDGWDTIVGRDDAPGVAPGQGVGNHNLFYLSSSDDDVMNNGFRVELVTRGPPGDLDGVLLTINNNIPVVPGVWHHVAAVGNAATGTLSLFRDGVLVGSVGGFNGLFAPTAPAGAWTIGRGQWAGGVGDWLNGIIDEVRFSNVALSPTEFLNFGNSIFQIVAQPASVTASVRDPATFTVVAGGGGIDPLTYQWQVSTDGGATWANIPGAIGASYTTPAVARGDSGRQFRVVVTRAGVNITSGVATLTVVGWPPPVVTQDIAHGPLVMEGSNFTFSVAATGLGNIRFQWQRDGVDLAGQTSSALNLQNVTVADEGTYSVIISDDASVADGLAPTTVTLSSFLTVAPHVRQAISLNFIGVSNGVVPFSSDPGILRPAEVAGAVPVANWNNSPLLPLENPNQTTPVALVDDLGAATTATATWSSANTWSTRWVVGPASQKTPNQRLFHGYIEMRAAPGAATAATVIITGIPFATYDVYVYPISIEGAPGEFMRRVTMADAVGTREFFMRNATGYPGTLEVPFILSRSTTAAAATAAAPATYFRFAGASGSTITLRHYDVVGWNSGGFAAISIVDTSANVPARPVITSRPASVLAPAGGAATLAVTATPGNAGGSLAYQWRRDGVDIPGAISATLSLTNITSANTGRYTVVVRETSALGTSVNMATADLVVVDETRRALLSVDINHTASPSTPHLQMIGHGILRTDGPVTIDPATGAGNPHGIGETTTVWNLIAQGNEGRTYGNLVDAQGLDLAGMTFTVTGAPGIGDVTTGGGIDSPITSWSGPLLRDYVFAAGDGVMTATVGGLSALAGREVVLVVYAVGPTAAGGNRWGGTHDDIAAVTLSADNRLSGQPFTATTDLVEGRELRFNNRAHATLNATISPAGTLTWTIGPAVLGEAGMNAFNGFQLLLTGRGELLPPPPPPPPPLTPAASWRVANFGAPQAVGNAAWAADPDGDGFNNLVEYAVGANPNAAGVGLVSTSVVGGSLRLTFAHIGDPAVTYRVEAAANLAGPWTVVHTYPAFTAAGTQTYIDPPVAAHARRFLRLRVSIAE